MVNFMLYELHLNKNNEIKSWQSVPPTLVHQTSLVLNPVSCLPTLEILIYETIVSTKLVS